MNAKYLKHDQIVYAHQIGDAIAISSCKMEFKGKLVFSDSDELFFERKKAQYIYIFKYGAICIFNANSEDRKEIVKEVLPFCKNPLKTHLIGQIEIKVGAAINKVTFGKVNLAAFQIDSLRLIMLNVSQSVALERYAKISEQILEDTKKHTTYLEEKGKLTIGGRRLKKYIGRVLNVKNRISENLYIFDSHDVTWEDETLNELDHDLKLTFDLKDRYRSIHDQIEIIKDNLELFKDITYHRESSRLEWIIIILILVEVVDMLFLKFQL